jgi:hypothetical protein
MKLLCDHLSLLDKRDDNLEWWTKEKFLEIVKTELLSELKTIEDQQTKSKKTEIGPPRIDNMLIMFEMLDTDRKGYLEVDDLIAARRKQANNAKERFDKEDSEMMNTLMKYFENPLDKSGNRKQLSVD